MDQHDIKRRDFLLAAGGSAAAVWAAVLAADLHATPRSATGDSGPPYLFFTPEEAREFDAISAQVIPTDETPGAREAGVVLFVDRFLATAQTPRQQQNVRNALSVLGDKVAERFSGNRSFAALSDVDQVSMMTWLAQLAQPLPGRGRATAAFAGFGLLLQLAKLGMFSHPMHGGNRGQVGWKMIGYEDRFVWTPPFGDYDNG